MAGMTREYFQGTLHERLDHYTDMSNPEGCWLWRGTADGKGYGLIWDREAGCNRFAHVVAWERAMRESTKGRVVRHDCDTPLCVRPLHLLIGTHADNTADKVRRGRQSKGSGHGLSRLTEGAVMEMRELYSRDSWSQRRLAKRFEVSQPTVSLVVNRKIWTHI